MPIKKTHEEFIKEINDLYDDKYTILEKYKGANTKILIRCNKCKYEWKTTPSRLLWGYGCPKCAIENRANKKRKTQEKFVDEIKKKYGDMYTILGEYKGARIKILVKCNKCGYEWNIIPSNLLQGEGCPKCNNEKRINKFKKTHKQFLKEIKEKHKDKYTILEKYKNDYTKIKVKCNICNYEWKAIPRNLLSGSGCPKCNQSKGENRVETWLKENNIKYETQYVFNDCKYKSLLKFDFYLPNVNVCIEYDGKQHFEPVYFGGITHKQAIDNFKEVQKRDKIKNRYCKNNNIKLLRIPYTEFDNIETILENFLNP